MLLLIDNYDSFTYNLYHYLGELGAGIEVRRNDEISPSYPEERQFSGIVISPGPCDPDRAGVSVDIVKSWSNRLPILGVCLGHQAIAQAFGGIINRAPTVMHGKISEIHHSGAGIFEGLPCPFKATRYHSLIAEIHNLPDEFSVTATTTDNIIMGIQHKALPVFGVQFHPESIETHCGRDLLQNFLKYCRAEVAS